MTSKQHEQPAGDAAAAYEPPGIVRLGTLADLTRGGGVPSPSDGFGAAGDTGSL
jgi:hypothetical protein